MPTTPVSVDYKGVAYDCAVNLAKDILGKDSGVTPTETLTLACETPANSRLLSMKALEPVNDLSGFANHGIISPTPATFTFGRTDTGNTTQGYPANQKAGNIFTCGATGQLSKLTVRMKRNTTSGKCAWHCTRIMPVHQEL